MRIRCISIDIDGTLMKEDNYNNEDISVESLDAIRDYCKSGGKVIFSTGRSLVRTLDLFKYLCSKGFSSDEIPYLVCLNGALIINTSNLKPIRNSFSFEKGMCLSIVDFLDKKKTSFFLFSADNKVYFKKNIFSWIIYFFLFRKVFTLSDYSEESLFEKVCKIVVVLKIPGVGRFKELIMKHFGDICYCSVKPHFYLEIIDKKIDKFYGIEEVSKLLDIPVNQFAAIGNEQNDVLSLENVGFGVGINFNSKRRICYDAKKINLFVNDENGTAVYKAIMEMKKRDLF